MLEWNKCRCGCENWLINVAVIKNLFGIIVSNFECECDKSCDVGKYLD